MSSASHGRVIINAISLSPFLSSHNTPLFPPLHTTTPAAIAASRRAQAANAPTHVESNISLCLSLPLSLCPSPWLCRPPISHPTPGSVYQHTFFPPRTPHTPPDRGANAWHPAPCTRRRRRARRRPGRPHPPLLRSAAAALCRRRNAPFFAWASVGAQAALNLSLPPAAAPPSPPISSTDPPQTILLLIPHPHSKQHSASSCPPPFPLFSGSSPPASSPRRRSKGARARSRSRARARGSAPPPLPCPPCCLFINYYFILPQPISLLLPPTLSLYYIYTSQHLRSSDPLVPPPTHTTTSSPPPFSLALPLSCIPQQQHTEPPPLKTRIHTHTAAPHLSPG